MTIEVNDLKPFFARYLEGQLSEAELEGVSGGAVPVEGGAALVTSKLAADRDDLSFAITLKYPSDGDDDLPVDFLDS